MTIARASEAVYALVAFVLVLGLPWPPGATNAVVWIHWFGSSLLAGLLAWRLRRPNAAMWYVAAILAGYVLVNSLATISRVRDSMRFAPPRTVAATAIIVGLVWVTQMTVLACLYQLRELRKRR
jgi:hypothetical protein